jgi:hypothetical protein
MFSEHTNTVEQDGAVRIGNDSALLARCGSSQCTNRGAPVLHTSAALTLVADIVALGMGGIS